MKKGIAFFLVLMLCLSLCACDAAFGNTGMPTTREISIGEKVKVGEYAFTITSVEFSEKATIRGQKWVAGDDEQFCIVYFAFYNESRKTANVENNVYLTLNYDNGYDSHFFRPEWQYGTNTWVTPNVSAQKSTAFKLYAEVPDIQAKDQNSPMVLQIKFMGEEFQLIVR